jgi:hypothetical protein
LKKLQGDFLPGLAILLVGLAAFLPGLRLRLLQDDWTLVIANSVFGRSPVFDWFRDRPLDGLVFNLLYRLFGLELWVYSLLNLLLFLGCAFLVYKILERCFPGYRPAALLAALLVIVYPANFTATWLTMLNNHLSWLLTLLAAWLLLVYSDGTTTPVGAQQHDRHAGHSGKPAVPLLWAHLLFFLPLWIYEGPLGFAAACILLVALRWALKQGHSGKPAVPLLLRRRELWALLSPSVWLIVFALMKLVVRPLFGVRGSYTSGFAEVRPAFIWEKLLEVSILLRAWLEPLVELAEGQGLILGRALLLLGLALLVGLCLGLGALWLRWWKGRSGRKPLTQPANGFSPGCFAPTPANTPFDPAPPFGWRSLALLLLLGLLGTVLAYFPAIFVRAPNLADISTRANLHAIPFAAGMLVALVAFAARRLSDAKRAWQILLTLGVLPLLALGIYTQNLLQSRWNAAWEKQQDLLGQLFELAPGFEPGTTVVVAFKGYQDLGIFDHPPLYSDWEIDDALRVLYEDPTLNGGVYFNEAEFFSEVSLTRTGLLNFQPRNKAPYSQVVFFLYNEKNGRLELVQDLKEVLSIPYQDPQYDPERRILPAADRRWKYRFLVNSAGD